MRTARLLLLGAAVAAGVTTAGMALRPRASRAQAPARYRCPMHPSVTSPTASECPVCGMRLTESAPPAAPAPAAARQLALTAEQERVIGLHVSRVEIAPARHELRAPGRVTPDETRVYRLVAGVEGSVHQVSQATTGSRVRKNQILATYYAPAAFSVIQLYILHLAGQDRAKERRAQGSVEGEGVALANVNVQQRVHQLENLGVSALQRAEIARTRAIPDAIQVVSPVDGVVLARNLSPGLKLERGAELYRIADLRRVWILADVFPHEARRVHVGARAEVSAPDLGGPIVCTIAEVLPQVDPVTRTVKLRLEVDNRSGLLRPDLFVDVRVPIELPAGLTVPADAVVDSGLARTVYVRAGPPGGSRFEARRVETGWRAGGRVEIVRGLAAGEEVVSAGTFFLDSETRMREAGDGAGAR